MNYFKYVERIRAASNGVAAKELDAFTEMLCYTAPEARASAFWHGKCTNPGITQICIDYFSDNNEVYEIFQDAKKVYSSSS